MIEALLIPAAILLAIYVWAQLAPNALQTLLARSASTMQGGSGAHAEQRAGARDEGAATGQPPENTAQGEESAAATVGAFAEPEMRPARRPRFRNRPRGWWRQVLADGIMPPSQVAAPPTASSQLGADTADEGAPARVAGRADAPRERRRRRQRGLIALALGIMVLLVALGRSTGRTAPAGAPTPQPTSAPLALTPIDGPPLIVKQILGEQAGLLAPREAVALPNGDVAVADTGHKRLVLLGPGGRVVRAVYAGATALQQPYALVLAAHALYVLDADRGAIERYDLTGRFVQEIIHDPGALLLGRSMSLGPDGALYIANPFTNSIVVVSTQGHLLRQIHTANGAGPGQFNQPSDVAVGAGGRLYVLDNQNNRIEVLTAAGAFVAQWPAPSSDTLHSVHLLPLPNGDLLASDPAGALLLYRAGSGSPTREAVPASGQPGGQVQPLGLSRTSRGTILVTDGRGNRLLVVSLPHVSPQT